MFITIPPRKEERYTYRQGTKRNVFKTQKHSGWLVLMVKLGAEGDRVRWGPHPRALELIYIQPLQTK